MTRPWQNSTIRPFRRLKNSLKLTGSIDVALIAGLRDVVSVSDQPPEDPKLAKLVQQLATEALDDLQAMRKREGTALAKDMHGRIQTMRDHRLPSPVGAPILLRGIFERMKQRIEKLLGGEAPDIPRLHQELAMYADRGDITEEIVRLDSHMIQFEQQLNRAESVGKTLDFLLQEMGREVNTIGSKANDAEIAGHVDPDESRIGTHPRTGSERRMSITTTNQYPSLPDRCGLRPNGEEFSSLSLRHPVQEKRRSVSSSTTNIPGLWHSISYTTRKPTAWRRAWP